MRLHNILSLCLATVFLGACNMMPPVANTASNSKLQGAAATPAFDSPSNNTPPAVQANQPTSKTPASQTVTFPNMVKTTELVQPEPSEVSEIEALLKSEGIDLENLDDEGFQTQQVTGRKLFVAQFTTRSPRRIPKTQVKIPETGSFQLKLTEGPVFKIVDQDATDGSALIQMPAATIKTWLHLSQNWRQNSSLEIEDPLYYVKDTVSTQKKSWLSSLRWLSMGLRPLPVPTEWASPYGKDLVLNFTAKDVSSFQMIWLRNDEKPADPPFGIKEIGPEGGTVELPGVGKLEIPAGALDEPVTIRLSQKQEHPIIIKDKELFTNKLSYYDYMGPILKIEPLGLKMNKNGLVYLNFSEDNKKRLGNNSPSILDWVYFSDSSQPGSVKGFLFSENEVTSVNSPIPFKEFAYITRVMSEYISPSSNIKRFWPKQSSFSTKQTSGTCPKAEQMFFVEAPENFPTENVYKTLEFVNNYYCTRFEFSPPLWFRGAIPILIDDSFVSPSTALRRPESVNDTPGVGENDTPGVGEVTIKLPLRKDYAMNFAIAHEMHHAYQFNQVSYYNNLPLEYYPLLESMPEYISHEMYMKNNIPSVRGEPTRLEKLTLPLLDAEIGYGVYILNAMRQSYLPVFRGEYQRLKIDNSPVFGFPATSLPYQSAAFFGVIENIVDAGNNSSFIFELSNYIVKNSTEIINNNLSIIAVLNEVFKQKVFKQNFSKYAYNLQKKNSITKEYLSKLEGSNINLSDVYHEYSKEMIRKGNFLPDVPFDVKEAFDSLETDIKPALLWKKINSDSTFLEPEIQFIEPNSENNTFSNQVINASIGCLSSATYKISEDQLKGNPRITTSFKSKNSNNENFKGFLISMKIVDEKPTILSEQEIPSEPGKYVTTHTRSDFAYIIMSNGQTDCNQELFSYDYLTGISDQGTPQTEPAINSLSYLYGPQTKSEIKISSSIEIQESEPVSLDTSQLKLKIESAADIKCSTEGEHKCSVMVQDMSEKFIFADVIEISDSQGNDDRLIKQEIIIRVPNHALVGGASYIIQNNGIESNILTNSVYACNMLPETASFQLASDNLMSKLKPCLARNY